MKNEIIRKRYLHYLLLMCILLAWTTGPSSASNYVTVATIGNKPHPVDKAQGMQKIVDQIKEFWHKELEQVLPDKPDLIVLPEYCDLYQGLTDKEEDEYFLFRKSQIQDFFASEAKANHCYIAFGMRCEMEDGSWRNSCLIVDREGNIAGIYDKNFPTIGDMRGGVKASAQTPLIQCDFGTIGCAICFDLNFDELRRTYVGLKPDIIIFPSMYHGGLVQSYWAYTCRSFFIGSMFSREVPSEIRNPLGEIIASNTNYFDYAVARINLDCQLVHIDYNKDKLFDLKKKYGDAVTVTDPDGRLDAILVESKAPNISVVQMLKEFDIELLDDYFDRSRKFRLEP